MVCVGMQWKPPAGAVTSSVARIKHARLPLVSTTTQYHNSTIASGFQKPFSHFCKLKIFVLISFIQLKWALSFLLELTHFYLFILCLFFFLLFFIAFVSRLDSAVFRIITSCYFLSSWLLCIASHIPLFSPHVWVWVQPPGGSSQIFNEVPWKVNI